MVDATHLLQTSVFNTMPDPADPAAPSQCMPSLQDPATLNDGSGRVCKDPPIWIFDGLLSEKLLQQVDAELDVLPWHSMNGRCVRMAELAVDGALEELPQKLRSVCHIQDVAEYGRIWVMDVIGRDQGPHIDGWELAQAKQQMHGVDLSRCSVQKHKGFSTVIPTLSFVVYFNDVGGIAFPEAELSTPVIQAKRGRIVMFQNYDDSKRPAHNPKAVHYGVYAGSGDDVPFKRVLTAGVMASETPPQLLGNQKDAPAIPGFLYAPIMHRTNTSCASVDSDPPPAPPSEGDFVGQTVELYTF
ncbi:CML1 [Symbiodinium natans]|uniref:CML1 protein n=1 Tax=Symbiodinium natans TaxID=878477 RepID=A0A812KJS7_9DINO|nr:CML1 [Symbiodinium natans]